MSELASWDWDDSLEIPEKCISYAGYEFCPRDSRWTLVDACKRSRLDFTRVASFISVDLLDAFKRVVMDYAMNVSRSHTVNCFEQFKTFVSFIASQERAVVPVNTIRSVYLLNYLSHLRSERSTNSEYWLGVLVGFLKKWHRLGYAGVEVDALALLDDLRLKGNPKGEAVLTLDAQKGPFTALELQSIRDELHIAFAKGDLTLRRFVLVWLFIATGARPVQLALLKVRDLKVSSASDSSRSYILSVPCAKARGRRHRERFTDRPLVSELGTMTQNLIEEVKEEAERRSSATATLDLPLFPDWGADAPLGFEDHQTSENLILDLTGTMDSLSTSSERTGQRIKGNSRRFRYTLGTRAAREGHGKFVIAALLDHTDTQNVDVYTETTTEAIERIDKAVAFQLAPLAQAFAGMIVTDETAADRGNDPTSRISDPRLGGGSGTCGKHGFCSALAPIACYTCRNFQPWLDGPHERMLDHLIAERERILELTGDQNVASAHDRTILAAAEVVRRCKIIKEETAN